MSGETRHAYQWDRKDFSENTWREVEGVIARHRGQPGALIPVLEEVQGYTGYLPEAVLRCVAAGLDLPLSQVYGVVTFYSYFTLKPRGRHQIRLCLGTACHVRGAQRNLEILKKDLRLEPGECSRDGEVGLEVVRCLGACGLAPVMMVDVDTHRQVGSTQLDRIISTFVGGDVDDEEGLS